MKNKLLIIIFTITSLFFVSHIYSFQFGVGTRGFVKKVIEKGQEEGKIPKTKEEKEKGKPNTINYTGKLDKLDLSQAKYLFLAPKSTSTTSPSPSIKGAIYKADMTQTEKTVFKMKENGDIEEVNLYDEQGNRFDVNVYYIVKLSTEFISVALEIKGVWIVTTTTQVVNGSTQVVTTEQYFPVSQWQTSVSTMGWVDYSQYQKQYLVRLEDGAVFEGRYLPNDGNKKIYQDMYGNYYYILAWSNSAWWLNYGYGTEIQQGSLLKLNTKDMSVQVVSAQGDTIPSYDVEAFAVDKYGNLAYLSMSGSGYKYRKTTATVDSSSIEHQGFFNYPIGSSNYAVDGLLPIVDINCDGIYFVDRVSEGEYGLKNLRVRKLECNYNTGYEIKITSNVDSVYYEIVNSLSYAKILSIGDKEISLLKTTSEKIIFPTIDLVNATTSYYYEVNYSTFGLVDYNNFSNGFLGYQVVSSTEVYVLIKTQGQQSGRYKYTFYAIYPKEERIEKVFYTEKYEPSQGWPLFSVDENGNIIITATDLDTGTKNVLKITPNPSDPGNTNNITFLQQGNVEIYYLVRVY